MKRKLWLTLALAALMAALVCGAALADNNSGTCGIGLTWQFSSGKLTISGTGDMGDYTDYESTMPWRDIHDQITSVEIGSGVTSIGNNAFFDCYKLTSVSIPDTVTSIGNEAFQYTALTSVTIPTSVTSIGVQAFTGCEGLDSIQVSSANPAYMSANGVLYNKQQTQLIECPAGKAGPFTIPAGVTSIEPCAFKECHSLTRITITDSVTEIKQYAFALINGLTSVIIPDSVTSIGECAFLDCCYMYNATIPASVTSIGSNAFAGCTDWFTIYGFSPSAAETYAKAEDIRFVAISGKCGDNLTWRFDRTGYEDLATTTDLFVGTLTISGTGDMWDYSFEDDDTAPPWCAMGSIPPVSTIYIDSGVTSIGALAFDACESATSVTIPNSVSSIGQGAFWDCISLPSITIPASVTSIGESAFGYCNSMTGIEVSDGNTAFVSVDGVLYNKQKTELMACPGGKTGSFTIPGSVTNIWPYAFVFCDKLTSVTIPGSVTTIGDFAFSECYGLTSLEIPASVTSIGDGTFRTCTKLTSVVIPAGVTSIGESAFSECYSLTSLEIPASVTSIGHYAFSACYGLTSLEIPASVTSIGHYAFGSCDGLTSAKVYNPDTIFSDEVFAFSASGFTITGWRGSTAEAYASRAGHLFAPLLPAPDFFLPRDLTTIGSEAFSNITAKAVVFPIGLTSIDGNPFAGSGVTTIYGYDDHWKQWAETNGFDFGQLGN